MKTTPSPGSTLLLDDRLGPGGERFVREILGADGRLRPGMTSPLDNDTLLEALRLMTYSRLVDERGVSFQRQGRIGTFAEVRGQEAASTGSALALDPTTDWVVQAYRELPALLRQGLSMRQYWLLYQGHPGGWAFPPSVRVLPLQIELAAQLPQAVGLAWGMRLQRQPGVVMAYFGDGASSEGDFYEAGNLAGLVDAPVVLFCQNNGWAISTPRARQTKASSIAAKAAAFGIPGFVVDGNDVMAVYAVTAEAVARARAGGGPTLIEAQTYRLGAHNTSDDATRYADRDEVDGWAQRDPLLRLRTHLIGCDRWDEARDAQLRDEILTDIDEAFEGAAAVGRETAPGMLFDHVYDTPPARMTEQRAEIEQEWSPWPS